MFAAVGEGVAGGIIGGAVEAFRIYREVQKDRIANRIQITNNDMMKWRKVPVGDADAQINVQYLFLNSASLEFYFYITKLREGQGVDDTDNFDQVLSKCTDNMIRIKPWWSLNILCGFENADQVDEKHKKFCKFIQSILYDVQHFALTLDDLRPEAVSTIIQYALYLVAKLASEGEDALEFQVFRNWDWEHGTSRSHAMIVLDSTFDCVASYEGPTRQEIMFQLAKVFAGIPDSKKQTEDEMKNETPDGRPKTL